MRLLPPIACLIVVAACAAPENGDVTTARNTPAQPTTEQLVIARQAGMHMAATLLYRGIKAAVKNGSDVKEQLHDPEGIALWAAAIPGLFPPGSAHPDSRAKPEIWLNKPDFDRKAADLQAAAERLAEVAKTGDKAGFAAQVPAVEAACAACHKPYRSD